MINEQFPFEEEDFGIECILPSGGKVTVTKLSTYDVVGSSPGIVYMPYTIVEKKPTIEESDMIEYFNKKLKYASKIPKSRFETIKINK